MIALNETNEYAAEIPFTLPLASDPLTGLTGWSFTLGEVQIKLPGGSWIDVAVGKIVEKGYGRFAARLTSGQTTTEGVVYIKVIVSGTQPFYGSETIGVLGGDIPLNGSGYIPFFLPNATDPVYGSPVSTADFTISGTLRICLPDDVYRDATSGEKSGVLNLGFGLYAFPISTSLTTKKGKAFIYAEYTGAQRFEGYSNILGTGSVSSVITVPDPIPVEISLKTITSVSHIEAALDRLCEQFRSRDSAAISELIESLGYTFDLEFGSPLS